MKRNPLCKSILTTALALVASFSAFSQNPQLGQNDNCGNALRLCAPKTISAINHLATDDDAQTVVGGGSGCVLGSNPNYVYKGQWYKISSLDGGPAELRLQRKICNTCNSNALAGLGFAYVLYKGGTCASGVLTGATVEASGCRGNVAIGENVIFPITLDPCSEYWILVGTNQPIAGAINSNSLAYDITVRGLVGGARSRCIVGFPETDLRLTDLLDNPLSFVVCGNKSDTRYIKLHNDTEEFTDESCGSRTIYELGISTKDKVPTKWTPVPANTPGCLTCWGTPGYDTIVDIKKLDNATLCSYMSPAPAHTDTIPVDSIRFTLRARVICDLSRPADNCGEPEQYGNSTNFEEAILLYHHGVFDRMPWVGSKYKNATCSEDTIHFIAAFPTNTKRDGYDTSTVFKVLWTLEQPQAGLGSPRTIVTYMHDYSFSSPPQFDTLEILPPDLKLSGTYRLRMEFTEFCSDDFVAGLSSDINSYPTCGPKELVFYMYKKPKIDHIVSTWAPLEGNEVALFHSSRDLDLGKRTTAGGDFPGYANDTLCAYDTAFIQLFKYVDPDGYGFGNSTIGYGGSIPAQNDFVADNPPGGGWGAGPRFKYTVTGQPYPNPQNPLIECRDRFPLENITDTLITCSGIFIPQSDSVKYVYNINIVDSLGCTVDTTLELFVRPKPKIDFTTNSFRHILCNQDTVNLSAYIKTPTNHPFDTYHWRAVLDGGGTGDIQSNYFQDTITYSPSFVPPSENETKTLFKNRIFKVWAYEEPIGGQKAVYGPEHYRGCVTDTATTTVTVGKSPKIEIVHIPTEICRGPMNFSLNLLNELELQPQPNPVISYVWTIDNRTTPGDSVIWLGTGKNYIRNPQAENVVGGARVSVHAIEMATGCVGDTTDTITRAITGTVALSMTPDSACYAPVTLNATLTDVNGDCDDDPLNPPAGAVFEWSSNNVLVQFLSSDFTCSPVASLVNAGDDIMLKVVDLRGCVSTATLTVPDPAQPSVLFDRTEICRNDSTGKFTASIFRIPVTAQVTAYVQNGVNGQNCFDINYVKRTVATDPDKIEFVYKGGFGSPIAQDCGSGDYKVTIVINDEARGCYDSIVNTFNLRVLPTPDPTSTNPTSRFEILFSPNDTVCVGTTVQLTAKGATGYVWDNFLTGPSRTKAQDSLALGVNEITVSGSIGSCSVLLKDSIIVQIAPSAPIFADTTIIAGDTTIANFTPCVKSSHIYHVGNPSPNTGYYWFVNSSSGTQLNPGYQGKDSMRVVWGNSLNLHDADDETIFVYGLNNSTQCKTDTAQKQIRIRPYPRILRHTFTGDNYLCAQDTAEYHITCDGPASTVRFKWSVLRGNGVIQPDADPRDSSVTIVWDKDTTITDSIVVYTYDSLAMDKCWRGPEYFPVQVKENPVPMTLTATATIVCEGDMVTFSTIDVPTYRYFWHVEYGDSSKLMFSQRRERMEVTVRDLFVTDDSLKMFVGYRDTVTGCANYEVYSDTITVQIKAKPELIHPTADRVVACQEDPIQLNITGTQNASEIEWKVRKLDPSAPAPCQVGIFGTFVPDNKSLVVTYSPCNAPSDTGYFVFTAIVKNLPCAVDSDTVMVYIRPFPTASITPNGTIVLCEGTPYTFGAPGNAYDTIVHGIPHWGIPANTESNPGSLSDANSLHPTYTPALGEFGFTTFTLFSSNNGICADGVASFTIEYRKQPKAEIEPLNTQYCITDFNLVNISVVPSIVTTYYQATQIEWSSFVVDNPTLTGGVITYVNPDRRAITFSPNVSAPRKIAFVLKVSNNSCVDSYDTTIVELMPPNAAVFDPLTTTSYCQGSYLIPVKASSVYSNKNQWTFEDITSGIPVVLSNRFYNAANGSALDDTSFSVYLKVLPTDAAGTYRIKFTAGNASCAPLTTFQDITIIGRPVITSITPNPAPRCEGAGSLPLTVTLAPGSQPTYRWSALNGGLSNPNANFTSTTVASPTYNFASNERDSTIIEVVVTSNICPGVVDRKKVRVYTRPKPVIAPTASPDAICPGQSITFRANHTNRGLPIPGSLVSPSFQYQWSSNPATTLIDTIPGNNHVDRIASPTITGTYTLTVTDVSPTMPPCTSIGTVVAKVYIQPKLTSNKAKVCYTGEQIVVTAILGPDVRNAEWETTAPSGSEGTFGPSKFIINKTGNVTVTYTLHPFDVKLGYVELRLNPTEPNINCNLSSDVLRVDISPEPSITAAAFDSDDKRHVGSPTTNVTSYDTVYINVGDPVRLDGTFENEQGTAQWNATGKVPNKGTFIPNNLTPNGTYLPSDDEYKSRFFELEFTNVSGCDNPPKSGHMLIAVRAVQVPNAFTPNGDGINDKFEIEGLPANSKLSVFDRWGRKVYESDNYRNDWDGNNLENGTYYYVLTYKLGSSKGYITLLK